MNKNLGTSVKIANENSLSELSYFTNVHFVLLIYNHGAYLNFFYRHQKHLF